MKPQNLIVKYLIKVNKRPFIVGIDGGTSSGKNYFLEKILKELDKLNTDYYTFAIDDYSIDRDKRIFPKRIYYNMKQWYNLDLVAQHIKRIKEGKCTLLMNKYKHSTGKKGRKKKVYFNGKQIVFLNGVYSLDKRIRKYLNLKVLLEATPEIRLKREIYRNVNKRFQKKDFVIKRFKETEEPNFLKHYNEVKGNVDIILDNNNWRKPKIIYLNKKTKW